MRKHGAYTCLVSGGFTLFTSRIGAMIGFDEDRANTLAVEGGRFSGLVTEPILGREAKLRTLQELTARLNLAKEDTLAVGDGANDIPMIEAAGLGVAYHGKPAVAAAAAARIDHGDLTALLYAQGYSRAEFVAASIKRAARGPPFRILAVAAITRSATPRIACRPRRSRPAAARSFCRPSSGHRPSSARRPEPPFAPARWRRWCCPE